MGSMLRHQTGTSSAPISGPTLSLGAEKHSAFYAAHPAGSVTHITVCLLAIPFSLQQNSIDSMLNFLKELFGLGPKVDYKALKAQGALIVDVRTPQEFRTDHLKGAANIPLDNIRKEVAHFQKKKKPVILYCRSGHRSGVAKSILRAAGIEAYNAGSLGAMRRALR